MDKFGINTSILQRSSSHFTIQAFASIDSDGEHDFIFNRGVDEMLDPIDSTIKYNL